MILVNVSLVELNVSSAPCEPSWSYLSNSFAKTVLESSFSAVNVKLGGEFITKAEIRIIG